MFGEEWQRITTERGRTARQKEMKGGHWVVALCLAEGSRERRGEWVWVWELANKKTVYEASAAFMSRLNTQLVDVSVANAYVFYFYQVEGGDKWLMFRKM